MYAHQDIWIEDICYDMAHIKTVLSVIKRNFEKYFEEFLMTNAGAGISADEFEKLKEKLGIKGGKSKSQRNFPKAIKH